MVPPFGAQCPVHIGSLVIHAQGQSSTRKNDKSTTLWISHHSIHVTHWILHQCVQLRAGRCPSSLSLWFVEWTIQATMVALDSAEHPSTHLFWTVKTTLPVFPKGCHRLAWTIGQCPGNPLHRWLYPQTHWRVMAVDAAAIPPFGDEMGSNTSDSWALMLFECYGLMLP